MAVDLYELDAIGNYKKAIAALEGYADKIIDDFLEAPEGQSYIQAHPDEEDYVGEWFLSVLTLTYKTEVVTLPHITPSVLEPILTQRLPTTLSPDEAADAGSLIPELIAFWSYLQRVYRLSTAPDIIHCLRSIQPIFNALVLGDASATKRSSKSPVNRQPASDNNLGNKRMSSLVQSLDALGDIDIDDLDQDDLDQDDLEDLEDFELEDLDGDLGDDGPKKHHRDYGNNGGVHYHVSPSSLVDLNVDRGITRPTSKAESPSKAKTSKTAPPKSTTTSQHRQSDDAIAPLSDSTITTLTQQTITADSPGTILHDFQVFLEAVGEKGIAVSGKTQYIPMKILADLNAKMGYSVQLDLKRPLQKNYPNIHGLCLLLKASGLGIVVSKGKKDWLQLQPELVAQWHQLNPTEQYFTLLNAWMIQATPAMIGDQNNPRPVGEQCIQAWCLRLINMGHGKVAGEGAVDQLGRMAGWYSLALLHLFGLVNLTDAKPNAGQGWCVKAVERSPLGTAIMSAIQNYYYPNLARRSESDPNCSPNELQPLFQPYFPECAVDPQRAE
ncbi:MAG: hypothetical protein F6K30_12740, partial [Cyanothece sp. SIO2G6]|nr:hypothetical protein [Cyanothece sp. SIO2G6]